MTVTLNQALFAIGQEISIADRANFPGRPGNPITVKATGSVFAIGAGNPLSQLQITKPQGTLTLFWDGTNFGEKSQF